ncbi:MAG: methyltransferase family protein [Sciscionella sp.]
MLDTLVWVLRISVWLWLLAELVLQARQYHAGGRATVTEWRSLGVILLSVGIGEVLASLAVRDVPALGLHIPWVVAFSVAIPVLWFGVGFRVWAIHTLGRYFRFVVHVQQGHKVVEHGPYRLVRHPSYSGLLLAIAGASLLVNNILGIVALLACVFAGAYYRIRVEERVLTRELGAEYSTYAAHTARLLPGVW